MLSHPANPEPGEPAVAAATSEMKKSSGNRRRQMTVEDFFGQFDREFFRNWFIDGPRLLLTGKFSRRAAGFMIAGALPAIAAALFLTVPGMLFPTPQHQAFFQFGKVLNSDMASLIPVGLGVLSSIFSFRLPLGS